MRTVDRILATSDIHGQNTRFLNLLKKTEYDPTADLLVVCGDMVDRGPENMDTLRTCQELVSKGAVILRGNHEQFLTEVLQIMLADPNWSQSPVVDVWARCNGGGTCFEEIKNLPEEKLREILEFIMSIPNYFTVGDYIFTHAGVNKNKPIEKNSEDDLVWADNIFPLIPAYKGKTVIFGHTPTWILYPHFSNRNNKQYRKSAKIWYDPINNDKIGIDTGGVFGGRLAMLELPSGREFYV